MIPIIDDAKATQLVSKFQLNGVNYLTELTTAFPDDLVLLREIQPDLWATAIVAYGERTCDDLIVRFRDFRNYKVLLPHTFPEVGLLIHTTQESYLNDVTEAFKTLLKQ